MSHAPRTRAGTRADLSQTSAPSTHDLATTVYDPLPAIAIARRLFQSDHALLADTLGNLALLMIKFDRPAEALVILTGVLMALDHSKQTKPLLREPIRSPRGAPTRRPLAEGGRHRAPGSLHQHPP